MMATAAISYAPITPAFAPTRLRKVDTAVTTQRTDVLSQEERRPEGSTGARHTVSVSIDVGPECVTFTYSGDDPKLPPWAEPVFVSLSERWGVGHGWDTYSAEPTNPLCVEKLLNLLSVLMAHSTPPPVTTPLGDGGFQAEWHWDSKDFEIVVPARDEPYLFFSDDTTGDMEELPVQDNYEWARTILRSL